ncbi:MAG TPA: hypothetical protein VF169_07635 [Albitalea sp.]
MRRVFAAFVVASPLCCGSAAMALGFGPVSNATRLGQPLDFSVAVRLDAGETLEPSCVTAEVSAGDVRIPPTRIRTRLVRARAGEAVARVTTTTRITEPVVTVQLALGCPPRASHKFVSLLDPPGTAGPRAEATRPAATAPVVATVAPVLPAVAMATPEAVPVAPTPDEHARDREMLSGLEVRLEGLRREQEATQQSIAVLQARLRDSEEARHHNDPALYGLSTLVVLLLGVIAMLLWRLSRLHSEQAWMNNSQALTDLGPRPSDLERPSPAPHGFDEVTMTSMRVVQESTYPGAATEPPPPAREPGSTTIPSAARMRRELTAEELIDLEQQADFFVALGQEDSAIDLLMGHVRSSGGTSPMPYLKLLEIYRRRGEDEAYERIRERFNRRFNAHAPQWGDDAQDGRTLDAYPDIVQRLQSAWRLPSQASDLLEMLLFRRDGSQGAFDLRAYEELLFLYALARDLVEHDRGADGVDLLLPMDTEPQAIVHAEATRAPVRREERTVDVDLDLGTPPKTDA